MTYLPTSNANFENRDNLFALAGRTRPSTIALSSPASSLESFFRKTLKRTPSQLT